MTDLTPARLEELLATVSLPLDNRGRTSREKSEAIETLIALYATLSSRVIELEAENARLMALLRKIIAASNSDDSAHLHGQIAKARTALEPSHD